MYERCVVRLREFIYSLKLGLYVVCYIARLLGNIA